VIANHASGVSGKGISLHLGRKMFEMEGLQVQSPVFLNEDVDRVQWFNVNSNKIDTKLQYRRGASNRRQRDKLSPR